MTRPQRTTGWGTWQTPPDPNRLPQGLVPPGQPPGQPPGEMPPAARALLDVVREAKGSLDQLYALMVGEVLTRKQVDLIGGPLWTTLSRARKELVEAGHPGGPGGHPGCPVCDLVDWLAETHPAPAPPSPPGVEA